LGTAVTGGLQYTSSVDIRRLNTDDAVPLGTGNNIEVNTFVGELSVSFDVGAPVTVTGDYAASSGGSFTTALSTGPFIAPVGATTAFIGVSLSKSSAHRGAFLVDNIDLTAVGVPEPSSICVVASIFGALALKRRRSR
jgi:hypothetical protein